MAHLERRRQLYYAVLTVPEDLREHFGKMRLVKSLGTPDKRVAEVIGARQVAQWKAEFLRLRGITNPLEIEAMQWQRELKEKEQDEIQRWIATECLIDRVKELEESKGPEVADMLFGLATGKKTLTNTFFEQWKAQIELAPKTRDQMVKDVGLFIAKFPTLDSIHKSGIKTWMEDLGKAGKGPASQKRILSFCRNYWGYLQSHDAVSPEVDPFQGVLSFKKTKKASVSGGSWVPFTPADVVLLWKTAGEKKDTQLQDLILLGAYTGARIEELCSLKLTEVTDQSIKIVDAKTNAGIREFPIHSALLPTVQRLKEASTDGFLISDLTFNKYGDRSNAIGKRFGRLKASLKFSDDQVFHSIRKTFTTLLENAGVHENVAADIVGHEKPRITYGLYSGGSMLEVMREAMEKVRYPF